MWTDAINSFLVTIASEIGALFPKAILTQNECLRTTDGWERRVSIPSIVNEVSMIALRVV